MIQGDRPRLHQDRSRLSGSAPPAPLRGHPPRLAAKRSRTRDGRVGTKAREVRGGLPPGSWSAPSAKSAVKVRWCPWGHSAVESAAFSGA